MRIAIDVRSLLDDQPGGVKTYTTEIVRALGRVAPEHEYLLFYNSAKVVRLPDLGGGMVTRGFRYPNRIFNVSQWALSWPKWDRLIEADCYFAPALRLVPLGLNKPLVATVHDLSFAYFPEFYSWRRRMWHRMMRPGALLLEADHLIAVSRATARDVTDYYGVAESKVSVVYSGIAGADVDHRAVRKKYGLPERYLLFLGTIEPRKNVPSIIKAFDHIAAGVEQDLVVAGTKGWLTKEVDEAISVSRFRNRICCPGLIDEVDKRAVMAGADLFVYPSFYEGFGFPPLESLIAGTPVITSLNSSLPEVVGDWATMVNPYDVGELAYVMKEMLLNPPVVEQKDRQAILEKYTWEQAARETLKVLEGVV